MCGRRCPGNARSSSQSPARALTLELCSPACRAKDSLARVHVGVDANHDLAHPFQPVGAGGRLPCDAMLLQEIASQWPIAVVLPERARQIGPEAFKVVAHLS